MRDLRRAVPPATAGASARSVTTALLEWPPFVRAPCVALYAALPDELPTRPLFDALREAGRGVLMPRVVGSHELVFCAVDRWGELRPGRYGVLEPPVGCPEQAPDAADCVLLPGVAFDLRGGRLGRGGGFYDAAFPVGRPAPRLVGMGYDFQVVDSAPAEDHDRRVDAIVTERGIREVAETR